LGLFLSRAIVDEASELMAELDAIKRDRIGGLMLCRNWGERGPWPKPDQPDFTHVSRKVKEVIREMLA